MSNSDLSTTVTPSKVNAFPDLAARRPRDTTNRLEVRMHKSTTFLAFAYRGTLWEFFPCGTFFCVDSSGRRHTTVKWADHKTVTPILFGLLAYRKTPYRASKGE